MLLNLTDVFTMDGKVEESQVAYSKDTFISQLGEYSIKEKTPVTLKLSNIGQGKALVEGNCTLVFTMQCDRCLQDVDYTFAISFAHDVVPESDSAKAEEDEDDNDFMEGFQLNVDTLIDNEILLSWPMKILCKDDCKGICKICGKNLNDGPCGCDDFVPDPRMAAIKDIFNQSLK